MCVCVYTTATTHSKKKERGERREGRRERGSEGKGHPPSHAHACTRTHTCCVACMRRVFYSLPSLLACAID